MSNPRDRIEDIDARLKELPKGTLTYKTINGKKQPYIQKSVDGKVTSIYVKLDERSRSFWNLRSGAVCRRRKSTSWLICGSFREF